MPRERRFSNRVAAIAACVMVAGAALVVASQGACITTPPPDLLTESSRPTILHDSVMPPVNEPLVTWPLQPVVPVQLNAPDQQFYWVVFVDYSYNATSGTSPGLVKPPTLEVASASDVDGGVVLVSFTLEPGALDLSVCHQIEFIVAQSFESDDHTPVQPPGGDDVIWNYVPGGGPECPLYYDAAEFGDGAFPPADAPSNALPPPLPSSTDGATASDAGSP
jgi:hypothetical protein